MTIRQAASLAKTRFVFFVKLVLVNYIAFSVFVRSKYSGFNLGTWFIYLDFAADFHRTIRK